MKNTALSLLMIIISTTCWGQRKEYSYTNVTFHQIEFSEITFTVNENESDTLQIVGTLKGKTIIDDIPCDGKVTLAHGWKLKKCTLAQDHPFNGNIFPKDTQLELGLDLNIQRDIRSMKYYLAIRGAGFPIINRCVFPSDPLINEICSNGKKGVFFQPDWDLIGCILANDDTIAGNILLKGSFIRYNSDSTLCCFCIMNQQIQDYCCEGTDYTHWIWMGGGGIFFYPSGRLKYFQPVDVAEIHGVACKHSSIRGGISLYENGMLKKCTSAIDQTIDGIFCEKNATLKFDENGKLTYAVKEKIFD